MYKDEKWSGRFSEPISDLVLRYTSSVGFDKELAHVDVEGSLAHAKMLCRQGVIGQDDLDAIEKGMAQILREIDEGKMEWSIDKEDVHMNIEQRLTELVGDAGKRLHTGRSRNDQVATDDRLWLRGKIDEIVALLSDYQRALTSVAKANAEVIMPGFTHLQVAQPVSFGHHMLAYVEMAERDKQRLKQVRARANVLPLGAAAMAGATYPIDREYVAKLLGFEGVCQNSMDAVSDRDFAAEFVFACSLIMTHISRLSEELVLWSSPGFGYVAIADRFCTGSSIMPQKKNPDVPELARGKTGRVNGDLVALLTLMKSQPLCYNKDNQEDKEPMFDAAKTVADTLAIFAPMVASLKVKTANMASHLAKGHATATDLADYLARKGVPFRDSHEIVAKAVMSAERKGKSLSEMSLDELRETSDLIGPDALGCLSPEGSVAARDHVGGTAVAQVRRQIERWERELGAL